MTLCMKVGLGPGHIVLDGGPCFLPKIKKGQEPPIFGQFLLWPNGWWIKMRLGMEVNLGPGDVVLDGVAAPP